LGGWCGCCLTASVCVDIVVNILPLYLVGACVVQQPVFVLILLFIYITSVLGGWVCVIQQPVFVLILFIYITSVLGGCVCVVQQPVFDDIYMEVRKLSQDPDQLSQMEKCTLVESLILIRFLYHFS